MENFLMIIDSQKLYKKFIFVEIMVVGRLFSDLWIALRFFQLFQEEKVLKQKQYLLIGESGFGSCGDRWLTWGDSSDDDYGVAPYVVDNFNREYLDDIRHHQICRTDQPGSYYHSQTVSFRRKKK